ncbi:MAG: hypothetical protein ACKVS7_04900 [Gemmatimonadaceae bacterium]
MPSEQHHALGSVLGQQSPECAGPRCRVGGDPRSDAATDRSDRLEVGVELRAGGLEVESFRSAHLITERCERELHGIVHQHPASDRSARGHPSRREQRIESDPALQTTTQRRVERNETRLPRQRQRHHDERQRRAAFHGGQGRRECAQCVREAGDVWCSLERTECHHARRARVILNATHDDTRERRSTQCVRPFAEEQGEEVITIGETVHDWRRGEQQHGPTDTARGQRPITLGVRCARVMGFIDDHEAFTLIDLRRPAQ